MKNMITLSIIASTLSMAGGYKIPEQSLNSLALGAAYVAHTSGADTAYFNPANMAFMGGNHFIEGGITLVHLPANVYTLAEPFSGQSEEENILMPTMHYVAPAQGKIRWGVSMIVPGGLTKRWETPYQKLYAEEFTLKNVEINPVISYKVNDKLAIGGGVRLIYSEGIVNSDGGDLAPVKREMEGSTFAFGYNLAMSYKPREDVTFAMTYRSQIDLDEEGKANLYFGGVGQQFDAEVSVPLPASFNVSIARTWEKKYTLEVNYERTYWSAYENLDFNYNRPIQAGLISIFDAPIARNWVDTNSFRLGATIQANEKTTIMAGIGIDKTPVPSETIGFELADSDAIIFSMGFRYQYSKAISIGAGLLYSNKEERSLVAGVAENAILAQGGTFSEGGAVLTTLGFSYEF